MEYRHVAYQIKGNDAYSNMEANMCCHNQEFYKNTVAGFNFMRFLDKFKFGVSQN